MRACVSLCYDTLAPIGSRAASRTHPPGLLLFFEGHMTRDELIQKIEAAKREMEHSGPIHRRDLYKHIRRLEKELRIYDNYHRHAQKPHITA